MFWRRRLPHWVPEDAIVFVTWRLAGTLPQPAAELLKGDMDFSQDHIDSGPRWLSDPRIARLFAEALLYGERTRHEYNLFGWVVMPNHVHLVLKPNRNLSESMRWLKTSTAVRANRTLGHTGDSFWQREYYDRWIRSDQELASVLAYVEANPVKAGLAVCPEDWPWSSAWTGTGDKIAGAPGSTPMSSF